MAAECHEIVIDGSRGEGGGQILRTALALALVTCRRVRFVNIRARRKQPGLRPQHRTAVLAAERVGAARVTGAEVGSRELVFEPSALVGGQHVFDVGTAGSATLVLQTILPALFAADRPSRLEIIGGTHNPLAPSYDFVERAFLPLLRRMGGDVTLGLERHGFYPKGGGRIRCELRPSSLHPLELVQRGAIVGRRARAIVAKLPRTIAERELEVVRRGLGLHAAELEVRELDDAASPGNAFAIDISCEHVTEVFAEVGERGLRAETVAGRATKRAQRYIDADVAVAEHLCDQLLLPLALAGGGEFTTLEPTLHTRTNAEIIRLFLPVQIELENIGSGWTVRVA